MGKFKDYTDWIVERAEPYFDACPCKGIAKKLGFSCAKSRKRNEADAPYFIHTHRARSKGYKSFADIPMSVLKWIDSTG